ncbi:MAG: creatininase family protein [Candidatus Bathyarchaeota archaeon]|nr:creatininase family protein [Candidatus Bathyarchaeota archaeon]
MVESGKSAVGKRVWFDELSTFEAKEAAAAGVVVIFPLGSVEEHGAHLPLCTDSIQAEHVAVEVAKQTGCLVLPPIRYGICNAGRNFTGTLSIEFDTLYCLARDILSELIRNGFNRIIVMSGHAGSTHMTALRMAAQKVLTQPHNNKRKTRIMVLSDFDFAFELNEQCKIPPNDGHAGDVETSRVMDIKADLVKAKGLACFPDMPRFEVVSDPEKYFPSGVMGDPTEASKEKGETINKYTIEQVAKLVEDLAGDSA